MVKTKKNTDAEADTQITDSFQSVLSVLGTFRVQITGLQNQIRSLEKMVEKNMRVLHKKAKKNKNRGNRKPSGFAVPTQISNELCDFMSRPRGTEVARTEVTQFIIRYIKDNELQNVGNRKIILPNMKLKSLLDVTNEDEVTYFNLQRYMNKHFVKKKKQLAAAS